MAARPKPIPQGSTVRLLHDFHTRGGRVYRAGLRMKVGCTEGKYTLGVHVRGRWHSIIVDKKDQPWYFELVALPRAEEDASVRDA